MIIIIIQQVSVVIKRGNMLSFIGSFTTDTDYILKTIVVIIVMIIIIIIIILKTRDSFLKMLQ